MHVVETAGCWLEVAQRGLGVSMHFGYLTTQTCLCQNTDLFSQTWPHKLICEHLRRSDGRVSKAMDCFKECALPAVRYERSHHDSKVLKPVQQYTIYGYLLLPSTIWQCSQAMQCSVHLFGKRASRPSVVASAVGKRNSLLFLNDNSGTRFLVDTGAAVSFSPPLIRTTRMANVRPL